MKKYLLTIIVFFIFYSPIVKSDEFMTQFKLDQLLEEVQILKEEVSNLKKQINNDVYNQVLENNFALQLLITDIVKSDLSEKEKIDLWVDMIKRVDNFVLRYN